MVDVGPIRQCSENRGRPLRRLADQFDELGEFDLADLQRDLADTLDPPVPAPSCPRCGIELDDVDSVEVRSWGGSILRTVYDATRALAEHRPHCLGQRSELP